MSLAVGAAGGTVALGETAATQGAGVAFTIKVPPNALHTETPIVITETRDAPPAGYVDYSPVYRVEPDTLSFDLTPMLSIPWQNALTHIDRTLSIYWAASESEPFERLGDSYTNAGFSQASLPGPGYFFVGFPEPEAIHDDCR